MAAWNVTQQFSKFRDQVNQIATKVTAIHPLVPGLVDPARQGELLKALYELTKNRASVSYCSFHAVVSECWLSCAIARRMV